MAILSGGGREEEKGAIVNLPRTTAFWMESALQL